MQAVKSPKVKKDIAQCLRAAAGAVFSNVWVLSVSVAFNLLLGFCPKKVISKVGKYMCVVSLTEAFYDVLKNCSRSLSWVALTVDINMA